MVEKTSPNGSVSVVEVARGVQMCQCMGCVGARRGWTVLGHCKNRVQTTVCVNPRARDLWRRVHNAERLVPGQRVEAGLVQGRAATALLQGLRRWTAATAVPSVWRLLSRRQMSYGTLGATGDQQASRVLRWQAAIGGYCASATAPSKGATD